MKFYCIISDIKKHHNGKSLAYLQEACTARGLEFVLLEADALDYSQDMTKIVETPSIVYRLAISQHAAALEALLVREGVATLYKDPKTLFARSLPWSPSMHFIRAGLPIIPTIFNIHTDQDRYFEKYAEQLGGFPVILKASGGSHGASVLRIDSLESLRSVFGFVSANKGSYVLKKFIPSATHLRMVVVGDQVADAIRYLPQPGDFRTNAVAVPQVEAYPSTAENQHYFDLAAKSVHALGLEFGGVDLLVDEKGDAYIAEVNFPCNFARNQMNTGVDVAGIIVDYLLAKAKAGAETTAKQAA